MDPTVVAALIGLIGIVLGAILQVVLSESNLTRLLAGKPKIHNILGEWRSSWGPYPEGPVRNHELLTITKQNGTKISGFIKWSKLPDRKWCIEGRYDGICLLLNYFPSTDSPNPDFLDYGCYIFKRKTDGSFQGYSTGFGPGYEDEEGYSDEDIVTAYHELRRKTSD